MANKSRKMRRPADSIDQKLDAILELLQDLFIIEGWRAGLHRDQVRGLLRIDMNRVSRVWQSLPPKEKGRKKKRL